jgi:hypothetical protein
LEEVLLIECEISALQLAIELFPITSVEEEWFLYLVKLDETRNDVALANEAHKNRELINILVKSVILLILFSSAIPKCLFK